MKKDNNYLAFKKKIEIWNEKFKVYGKDKFIACRESTYFIVGDEKNV
jgi:hypothetical protein